MADRDFAVRNTGTGEVTIHTGELPLHIAKAPGDYEVWALGAAAPATVVATVPANTTLPAISGVAKVGSTLSVSNGTWSGSTPLTFTFQWKRAGTPIAGATASTYALVGADDTTTIAVTVTATNVAGSASATSSGVAVTYPAPTASGSIPDKTGLVENTGVQTYDVSSYFSGVVGGSWSLPTTVTGVTINSSGVVQIDTDTSGPLTAESIVARYTNSGGQADQAFSLTVDAAVAPTVDDQDASFGALTVANAGGFRPVDSNGDFVALTGISDQSAMANVWAIASGRLVCTAVPTGDDAKTLTATYAGGSVDLTIGLVPNAYSVRTEAEANAAVTALAAAGPSVPSDVIVRSGSTIAVERTTFRRFEMTEVVTIRAETAPTELNPDDMQASHFAAHLACTSAGYVDIETCANMTFRWLDIFATEPNGVVVAALGTMTAGGRVIRECRLAGVYRDPLADYSAPGAYDGTMFIVTTTGPGLEIYDSLMEHGDAGWRAAAYTRDVVVDGCALRYTYSDPFKLDDGAGGEAHGSNAIITNNLVHSLIGLSSDADNPHQDILQFLMNAGTGYWGGIIFDDNRIFLEGRSKSSQGVFSNPLSTGSEVIIDNLKVRRNLFSGSHSNGVSQSRVRNCEITDNTFVRTAPNIPDPGSEYSSGMYIGTAALEGNCVVSRNIVEKMTTGGGIGGGTVTVEDNVVLGDNGATITYADAFTGPTFSPTSLAEMVAKFTPKAAGPAEFSGAIVKPFFIGTPSISGPPQPGEVLTATYAIGGVPAPAVSIQWMLDSVDIPGETGATYTVDPGDVGGEVTFSVLGANAHGSATTLSSAVTVAAPSTITVDSASARFPDKNVNYTDDGQIGAYETPMFAPDFSTKAFVGDGCMLLSISVPWRSLTPTGAPFSRVMLGIAGCGESNTRTFGFWAYPTANENTTENAIRFIWKPNGTLSDKTINVGTAENMLLVMRREGADFFSEVYSDGVLIGRATEAGVTGDFIRYTALLGAVGDPNGPMSGGTKGHFNGEIKNFGYIDATVTEADCIAMSKGVPPETQLSGWRYLVDLGGATPLVPVADPDVYGNLTVTGSGILKGGDVLPAYAAGDWFRMDPVNAGQVWSVAPGGTTSTITLEGKASGIAGTVEARYFDADGTLRKDWTVLTGSTIAAGAWTGTMTAPLGSGWGHVEARPTAAPAMAQRSRKECGVGYDILFLGQSQVHRLAYFRDRDRRAPSGAAVSAVVQTGASGDHSVAQLPLTPGARLSDAYAGASEYIASVTTAPVRIIDVGENGTAPDWMMDDSDTRRLWSDMQQILDVAKPVSGVMVMNWGTAFLGAANIGGVLLDPLLTGAAPSDASYTVDHWLYDGTFPATMDFAISPVTPHIGATAGPLDAQPDTPGAQSLSMQDTNEQFETYCATNSLVFGPPTSGVIIETSGGPHEDPNSIYGHDRLAIRMAETAFRAFGVSTVTDPTLGAGVRAGATITIPATLPNGGTLQTAWSIAGETPPTGWTTVQGFEVSEDGGTTWSNGNTATGTAPIEFTAEISGSDVVLTRATGSWAAGTKWRYAWQAPLDYGTAMQASHLQHGLLYEGDGDGLGAVPQLAAEGGIGTPLRQASGTAA